MSRLATLCAATVTPADPMTPPGPEAPRFDTAQNARILSRYVDICAALHDPHLWPLSGKREIQPDSRNDNDDSNSVPWVRTWWFRVKANWR